MDFRDPKIEALYLVVRKPCCGVSIGDQQREAVILLGGISRSGNEEARSALELLRRAPYLHPHLREMVTAELRQEDLRKSPVRE
jgi:hypothetical protein